MEIPKHRTGKHNDKHIQLKQAINKTFPSCDHHIISIGICTTTTNQSGRNFSLVVFDSHALLELDSVDQAKKVIDEMNQKSNKGFVITTDVTSITYYFE